MAYAISYHYFSPSTSGKVDFASENEKAYSQAGAYVSTARASDKKAAGENLLQQILLPERRIKRFFLPV